MVGMIHNRADKYIIHSKVAILSNYPMKLLYTIIACLCALASTAQITPRSILTSAPEEVIPSINKSTILDMIDYYESGSTKPSANKFGTDARITAMDSCMVTLTTGNGHELSIANIAVGKQQMIMVIDRVATPSIDATLKFYSSKWVPVETRKVIKLPNLHDWIGKITDEQRKDLENALPFLTYDITFDTTNLTLTLTPTIGDYVSSEDREMVESLIAPQITYYWKGNSFRRK